MKAIQKVVDTAMYDCVWEAALEILFKLQQYEHNNLHATRARSAVRGALDPLVWIESIAARMGAGFQSRRHGAQSLYQPPVWVRRSDVVNLEPVLLDCVRERRQLSTIGS
jgi:hypothetical protein